MQSGEIPSMHRQNTGQLLKLRPEDIHPGRYQPRKSIDPEHVKELQDSLNATGLHEPIIVRASPAQPGKFELISGEYRWRAATTLEWPFIEAYLSSETDQVVAIAALTANGGLPLDPIEEAEGFARLCDEFQMTHAQIAKACGKGNNRAYVSKAIRMLKLPTIVRGWIAEKRLTPTHAQILLGFEGHDLATIAEKCVRLNWSTDRLRSELAARSGENASGTKRKDQLTLDWMELEEEMSKRMGLPVEIKSKKSAKKESFDVKLECESKSKLEALLNHLKDFDGEEGELDDIAAA